VRDADAPTGNETQAYVPALESESE